MKTTTVPNARLKLLSGIEKLTEAVGSTLGPLGNTVIIQDSATTRGVRVTKDGVTVAKSINLPDPVEGMAATMLREAAERTASLAGDGTTTSIILADALLKAGFAEVERGRNVYEVAAEIRRWTSEVIDRIADDATGLDDGLMESVATISANNDEFIGGLVADAYKEVGRDGVITPERSKTGETYYEVTRGISVDRGVTSPLFITNRRRGEAVLEDCYVMVADTEITNLANIPEKVWIEAIKRGILFISESTPQFINALGANVARGQIKACHIEPPSFGADRHESTRDLARALGATYFSEKTGNDMSMMTIDDLAVVRRVVVSRSQAIIIPEDEDLQGGVVAELSEIYKGEKDEKVRRRLKRRMAMLSGGVGVVYAGGETDVEVKELYDRIEDAILAVESAIDMGITPGGGVGLRDAILDVSPPGYIADALQEPRKTLFSNGGLSDPSDTFERGYGYCAKTMTYGEMIPRGIIDPAKVAINAIKNAVSVATTIMGTKSVVIRVDDEQ